MKLVQRANKQLCIADDRLEEYVRQGYKEIKPTTKCICPICGKEYANETNLKRHLEKEHPSDGDT